METKDQFVKLGILYNAFDSSDVQKSELLYQKENTLADYLEGLPEDTEWQVALNGVPVDQSKFKDTEILPDDLITMVLVPQGGGAKDILRLVAMVALVVAATYFLGPLGPVVAGGMAAGTAAVLMAVVIVAGTLIINALLPPTVPKQDVTQGQNYGYDGAKNTAREGIAIPVVYGNFRMAGNYIDVYTENYGSEQYLYGRCVLSDGEIHNVTDIELNEQPIGNYQEVQSGWTAGTNTEPVNYYFGRSLSSQAKGSTITTSNILHTTTTAVDAVQFGVVFPSGLVEYNDKGKKKYRSVTVEYGYRIAGSGGGYTTGYRTFGGSDTRVQRHSIEVSLPRGTYETYIRRTTVDAPDDGKIFDTCTLTEVVEIQASNVAVRSTATGWYRIKMTDQINGIPKITWKVAGVKVKQYSATGAVVTKAWSDNPAWIILDMIRGDERGAFPNATVDYQAFYDWAQYCEGNGFKFNGVFDDTESLWDIMAKVYKVGRAMPIRIGTKLSVAIDKPSTPVMMFGAGNIEKDSFNISYLPLADRANEFEVAYYDKDDGNKKKTLRVIDPEAEARGEIPRPAQYELFGVDNFEQAQKEVWYQLYQNRLTRKVVSFRAPVESIGLTLGDVALIQHDMVNWGISGRIKQGISTTQVKLDRPVTLADGDTLMVIFDSVGAETDVIEERTVTAIDTVNNIVTVGTPFSAVPQDLHNYMFGMSESVSRPFRLRSVGGDDLHSRELSFVEYNDFVYSAPEQTIPAPNITPKFGITNQVTNLAFTDAMDYGDTIEKDVIATVGWRAGSVRDYAGADVYIGTIAKEDFDNSIVTQPTYRLHSTVNSAMETKVVAEYDDYVYVKVVAFNTKGIRANYASAPVISALVADPVVLTKPKAIEDGSEFAYTNEANTSKVSWEFLYDGIMAEVDGFFVDVEWSNTVGFESSTSERFILNATQRAIILGNINTSAYYRFTVRSFKRVHDIFSVTGLATSDPVNAFVYPYRPIDTTAYVGDISETITTTNPYMDLLDFINFNPNVTVEEPALFLLSTPNISVGADEDGEVSDFSTTGTTITVYQGNQELTYNALGDTAGTWRIASVTATNCTAGAITDIGTKASVAPLTAITTGTTVKTAKLDFVLQGKTLGNKDFTLNATQTINKLIGADIDNTPPSIPTGLAITSFSTPDPVSGIPKITARVTWSASPEADTAGYILAIKEGTGNFVEFKLGTDLAFEFPSLPSVLYTAKIKSYDKKNNISSFSGTATHTTVKDTTPPALATGLTATASFRTIFLSWTNPSDADVSSVRIYVAPDNNIGNAIDLDWVNAEPSSKGTYTHSGLTTNTTRYYWIRVYDSSGNFSDAAGPAGATTLQAVGADITDAAITTAKFASTIEPVTIVSSVPGTLSTRSIFNTTDGKLYRWNGTAYIATVLNTDISGLLADSQIEAIHASKVTGQLDDSQIAGIAAAKLTTQITSTQITDLAITTPKIAAGAVDTAQLNADAVSADKIATNAITAVKIDSGAVTTAKLAVGAVTADKITANTITSNKLALLPTGNMINGDPAIQDVTMWFNEANSIVSTDGDFVGSKAWESVSGDNQPLITTELQPFDQNKVYRASIKAKRFGSGRPVYLQMMFYDANKNPISSGGSGAWLAIGSWHYFGLSGGIPNATATTYNITFSGQAGQEATAPSNARYMRLGSYVAYGSSGVPANYNRVGSFSLQEVVPAELIVNGAITADKLAVNSVIAGKVQAGAIGAAEIAANAITATKLAIGDFQNLVSNGQFLNGTIDWPSDPNTGVINSPANALAGRNFVFRSQAGASTYIESPSRFPVKAGEEIYFEVWARVSAAISGSFTPYIRWDNKDGTQVAQADFSVTNQTTWTKLSANVVVPSTATSGRFVMACFNSANIVYIGEVTILRRNAGSLIVDGSITTNTMTANTINGDRIEGGTLHADKIVTGSITGDRFNTGTSLPGTITVGATGVTIETVRTTANTANSTANTANSTANTANATANIAIDGVKVARSKNLLPIDSFVPGGTVSGAVWQGIETPNDTLELATGPDGTSETIWKAVASGNTGPAGGWNVYFDTNQGYNASKTYLYSYFARRMTDNQVSVYLGPSNSGTQTLAGNADANPYWIYHGSLQAFPVKGKWYLVVGVLHGSSATTTALTKLSGVYDPVSGVRIIAADVEFRSAPGTTSQGQRVYAYYPTVSGDRIDFARPVVEELGNSPILDIITQAGGHNLFPDSSFEGGLPPTTATGDGGGGTRTLITSGGAVGSANYIRVNSIGGHQFTFNNSSFMANSDKVTISAWVKDSGIQGTWGVGGYPDRPHGLLMGLRTLTGGGTHAWQGVTPNTYNLQAGVGWTRVTQVITGLTVGTTYYLAMVGDYYTGSRQIDIDAIMVEHGGTGSTDWSASSVDDPATRINSRVTKIDPGKITISGATTLSDWRNGGDNTKIEGGSIAANTISANKVSIGVRGVTIEGIEFQANMHLPETYALNYCRWSAGTITYTNDAGTTVAVAIGANYTGSPWTSGTYYIYWPKGSSSLLYTSSAGTANAPDNIVLATYRGGTDLVVSYGRTIIDGSKITTGTISANKLNVASLSAISANIGLLQSATSGARTEIENTQIRVYDSAGTLRVRLGVWP